MSENRFAEVDALREKIDRIDVRLVDLLNDRAGLAIAIGHAKRRGEIPVHSPQREVELLERAQSLNRGPLSNESLVAIFQAIIAASASLE